MSSHLLPQDAFCLFLCQFQFLIFCFFITATQSDWVHFRPPQRRKLPEEESYKWKFVLKEGNTKKCLQQFIRGEQDREETDDSYFSFFSFFYSSLSFLCSAYDNFICVGLFSWPHDKKWTAEENQPKRDQKGERFVWCSFKKAAVTPGVDRAHFDVVAHSLECYQAGSWRLFLPKFPVLSLHQILLALWFPFVVHMILSQKRFVSKVKATTQKEENKIQEKEKGKKTKIAVVCLFSILFSSNKLLQTLFSISLF